MKTPIVIKPLFSNSLFNLVRDITDDQFAYNKVNVHDNTRTFYNVNQLRIVQNSMIPWVNDLTNNHNLVSSDNSITLFLYDSSINVQVSNYDCAVLVPLYQHNKSWNFYLSDIMAHNEVFYSVNIYKSKVKKQIDNLNDSISWHKINLNPNNALVFNPKQQLLYSDKMIGQCAVVTSLFYNYDNIRK